MIRLDLPLLLLFVVFVSCVRVDTRSNSLSSTPFIKFIQSFEEEDIEVLVNDNNNKDCESHT